MSWYMVLVIAWMLTAFLTSVVAIVASKSKWPRIAVVGLFFVTLGLTFAAPLQLLSRAKPAEWELAERNLKEAEIKGVEIREGEGIYIMLLVKGEPRLYVYPYSQKMAENLIQAMQQGQAQGQPVMLGRPFRGAQARGPVGRAGQAIGELLDAVFGTGEGQGEGQGQGRPGEGQPGQGEGGNFSGGTEDRDPPMAYPKPREALPPKPRPDNGTIYERNPNGKR
jgi:hypothetical protein